MELKTVENEQSLGSDQIKKQPSWLPTVMKQQIRLGMSIKIDLHLGYMVSGF